VDPHSGWPLDLDDLRPYYDRAWKLCGFHDTSDVAAAVRRQLGPSNVRAFGPATTPYAWRFAPSDGGLFFDFGRAYHDTLRRAANVTVLLHANLTRFETDDREAHIRTVRVQSLNGMVGNVTARSFVLSCSGLENPRLLLACGADRSPGIGNAHGLVGRYFMEHSRALAATIYTTDRLASIQNTLTEFVGHDGVRYQTGLTLSDRAQREHGLLNCSAVFGYTGVPNAGITAAQDVWRNLRDGHWPSDVEDDAWYIVRDTQSIGANLERQLDGRPLVLPISSADVVVDIEQVPDPESRVGISRTTRDVLDMPTAVVDWRVSELERETVRRFMIEIGSDFARSGIGRLRLAPWLDPAAAAWKHAIVETFHYMGTTRMAESPLAGVVDTDCRVHGIDNLFVAGSSVFPTGGQVNPTLTIVALALRLADHLGERGAA
jgi:choline dehydrogenase-like flavoprotein